MGDYERLRLAMPCATLVRGATGLEQPSQVKSRLGDLEHAGLIEYRKNRRGQWGWYLTARGVIEARWAHREAVAWAKRKARAAYVCPRCGEDCAGECDTKNWDAGSY